MIGRAATTLIRTRSSHPPACAPHHASTSPTHKNKVSLGLLAGWHVVTPVCHCRPPHRWYPNVNGIFFDEMADTAGHEEYYRNLTAWVNARGYHITVGNPGEDTLESYIGTVDTLMIYESAGLPSISSLQVGEGRAAWLSRCRAVLALVINRSNSPVLVRGRRCRPLVIRFRRGVVPVAAACTCCGVPEHVPVRAHAAVAW